MRRSSDVNQGEDFVKRTDLVLTGAGENYDGCYNIAQQDVQDIVSNLRCQCWKY